MKDKKQGGWRKETQEIEQLRNYIRLCQRYKQKIRVGVYRINLEYEKGLIDHQTYTADLNYYLDNKSPEQWLNSYDQHIKNYKQEIEKRQQCINQERQRQRTIQQTQQTSLQYLIATIIVLTLIAGVKFMSPTITGLLVAENITEIREINITLPVENITEIINITMPIENITAPITNITNITLPEIINITIPEITNITNVTLPEVINVTIPEITNITLPEITNITNITTPIEITPELHTTKATFKAKEPVTLELEFIKEQELVKKGIGIKKLEEPKQKGRWISAEEEITAQVYDSSGTLTTIQPEIEKERQGKFKITLPKPREFKAGLYTIKTQLTKHGVTYTQEQEFAWGVLAINTNKATYLENQDAFIAMAVLDNQGRMVCDAELILTITSPKGQETTLTTANNDIKISPECSVYGITNLPDYYTTYAVSTAGTYLMTLTAITSEGVKTITDNFIVSESVDFDVSREAPTRIYPAAKYTTQITINANTYYSGPITEIVPASFDITPQQELTITTNNNEKTLIWNKELTPGTTTKLSYEFDAPDTSPQFYLTGPLTIGSWQEQRQWQIASDVTAASYYTFVDITNNKAFWASPAVSFSAPWSGTQATAAQYTNLSLNDVKYARVLSDTLNDEPFWRFNFTINQTIATINWINVSVKGYENGTGAGERAVCYVYNYTSAAWINIGQMPGDLATNISIISKNFTNRISDIINTNNKHLVVYCEGTNFDANQDAINVDFVSLSLEYTLDTISPKWDSNTTNASTVTIRGGNVSFGVNLQDEIGLDLAYLELNGSGEWRNYTLVDISGASKTLNETNITWNTRGQYVCGKYWFNDTANNANQSGTTCFTVANTPPTTPPTLSPADHTNITTNTQQLGCSGSTDADSDTINYEFYINTSTDPTTLHQNNTGTTYNFIAPRSGAYYWRCRANDAYGANSYTTSRNLYIDLQPPQTNISIYNNASANTEYTAVINWTANISDDMSLSYAWLEHNATNRDNGAPKLFNESIFWLGNAKNYNVSKQIIINVTRGNYTCARYWFNDTSNNKNVTSWSCFNIVADQTPPSVTVTDTPDPQGLGENVTISATITDYSGISAVKFQITSPSNVVVNFTNNTGSGNNYILNFLNYTNGTYTYRIFANDTLGNMNSAQTGSFEIYSKLKIQVRTIKDSYGANEIVNITDPAGNDELIIKFENIKNDVENNKNNNNEIITKTLTTKNSPEIISAQVTPTKVTPGDIMIITAEITDNYGIKKVTADMGGIEIIDLELKEGNIYEGIWNNTWKVHSTETKEYNTTITATNNLGRKATKTVEWKDPVDWWNTAWHTRKQLNITNNNATNVLRAGYSVNYTLNTSELIGIGKMRADGYDLRIVYYDGTNQELNRVNGTAFNTATTQIWFKLQRNISASGWNASYYMYYNNPDAGAPPENRSKVYLWFDDFNRSDVADITVEEDYNKTYGGTWSIENGMLKNVGAAGDPNKLMVNALGIVDHDVEMFVKMNVSTWVGNNDEGRMGLSCCMNATGAGYAALFHTDQTSLDLLNDLLSWGTLGSFSWSTNTSYFMRFIVINPSSNLGRAKAWAVGSSEPSSWTVDGTFGTGAALGYGRVGIGGSRQADITYFDDFTIRYILLSAPTVTNITEEEINALTWTSITNNASTATSSGGDVNWTAMLYSNVNLNYATLTTDDTGTWTNQTFVPISGTKYNFSYKYTITAGDNNYVCGKIWFNDTSGKSNETDNSCFTTSYVDANQSKIANKGATNASIYVLMKVQYYNTATGVWVDDDIVVNDTTPRRIQAGTELKLDALFNGLWSTTANASNGGGTYRIMAIVTDNYDNTLINYTGAILNATYNFTIDTTSPTWNNIYNNASTTTYSGGNVNWTANISDNIGLSYAWLEHNGTNRDNGAPKLFNESIFWLGNAKNYNVSKQITINVSAGNYTCARFWFKDASNNLNKTDWSCFTVAVTPAKSISVTGSVNFGSGAVLAGNEGAWLYSDKTSSANGSWTWSAQEFIITNDGNQAGIITVNASQNQENWIGTGADAFINGTESAANNGCSGNTATFNRLNTTNAATICSSLASGTNNKVEADIKIYIPSTIQPGTEKWTNVTFYIT